MLFDEIKDSTRVRPGPGDRIQERLIETSMGHLCTSASARIQKQAVESSRATQLTHFQHLQNDDEKVIEGEWGWGFNRMCHQIWSFSGTPHLVPLSNMGWGAGIQTTIQAPSINQLHGPVMSDRIFVHSQVKASISLTPWSEWRHCTFRCSCSLVTWAVPQYLSGATVKFNGPFSWTYIIMGYYGLANSMVSCILLLWLNLWQATYATTLPIRLIRDTWNSASYPYSIPQKCLGLCNMFFSHRRPIWHQFDGSIDAPCPGTQVAAGGSALCDCVAVDLRIRSKICAGCCHH